MNAQSLAQQLLSAQQHFNRSTGCLKEEHSGFRPVEGMFTVAQQIAHVARDIDWFLEGAFRPEGFSMDFEKELRMVLPVTSLAAARSWLDRSFETLIQRIGSCTPEQLAEPLPAGPVLGGEPRMAIVAALIDHTAHHRGALTVYSRLQGLTPAVPYM